MLRDKILGKKEIKNENIIEKEEKLRMLLLFDQNNIDLKKELCMLLFSKGECEGALKLYEQIWDKNRLDDIGFLGYLYYESGKYINAIKLFNKYLDKKPNDAFVYFLLGNTYSRGGRILEAINSYEMAIFLDFDIYKAHLDFAKDYEKLGRKDRALKEYIAAYEIDPRDKEIEKKIIELKKKG